VADFARQHRRRVDFHRWLQWLLDRQLRSASRDLTIVHDVAVGFAADGFDAWLWQDVLAPGMSVGAPPDEFNLAGQDWGIPPFDPRRLRAAGYRPFVETLRRLMRPDGGVRIDHVMGLFRLWWVPVGAEPRDGVYVRYPAGEMLDVLARESARSTCYVIGEDLGTVERGVRNALHARRVLSYRIAWFESVPPRRYTRQALAALTTHDLPTAMGLLTGEDVAEMKRYGLAVNLAAEERARRRLLRLARPNAPTPDARTGEEVVERAYAALAEAPSMLVAASLDDMTLAVRRPNLPGAMTRPNWSIPLPRTLEQLRRDRLPRSVAAHLRARG
jgi:4-alpha-glucanotransferase